MRFALFLFAVTLSASIFELVSPTGLDFHHQNSPTPQKYLIETMGGGVALLDYNHDGLLDIFLVNSGEIKAPLTAPENFHRSDRRFWNRLYRQNKDGSFTDVTESAGLTQAGDGNYGMGVAAADYDNDGYTDLYVTSYGRNILYHNNGDGTFTDVTAKAGVAAGGWSASAGFFDYDNDGKLDLFVTRYMEWDAAHSKVCARQTYCPPVEFPKTTSLLFHNRGDGTFEDVSAKSGIAAKSGRALGVAFNDYDADGYTDIFVANDGMEQFLFHNNKDGTFTERALDAGVSLSDNGQPFAGMGVDFRDYDNDGRPDIIVTDLAKQVYAVYHNDGAGAFSYRSLQAGLGVLSARSSGWGMRLEDFNNDGWKDLFVAQSHVMDNVETVDPSLHYLEPPLVALNHNGRFERADPGTTTAVAGRGAAFGDLRNSGSIDVVMSVLGGKPQVFRNTSKEGHWLTLELEGTRSNRDGFGARVEANGQWQYVNSGGSYLSASDKRVHFGLGSADTANVEIWWPSGKHQTFSHVHANQFMRVREGDEPAFYQRGEDYRRFPLMLVIALSLGIAWQTVSPEVVEHVRAGVAAQKQGRMDVAIAEFKRVTELAPTLPAAFVNLGAAYMQTRNYADAIPPLKRSLELKPDLPGAQQMLGYALLSEGYPAEAIPYFEKAGVRDGLGIAQVRVGRFTEAIENLSAALAKHPNDPELLYYLGRATGLLSKEANDTLQERFPDSARAHQALAENYAVLRQVPEAEKNYLDALRAQPDARGVHLALGQLYAKAGDWAKAEDEFRAESKLQPGDAESTYWLGDALLEQGKVEAARKQLERADQLRPNMPETLYALGKADSLSGNAKDAEGAWQKLISIESSGSLAAQAHFGLAGLYRKQGKTADAAREMDAYQKLKK